MGPPPDEPDPRVPAGASASLLESVLESPDSIVIFSLDREYRYTAFNTNHRDTMRRIWGVEIQVGMCMLDVITADADRAKAKGNFDRALLGQRFTRIEEYGEPPNRFVYEDVYNPILDREGLVVGLTVFLTDITERRRAQRELERYQSRLEELVEERTKALRDAYNRLATESVERRRAQELLERAQRLESLGTLAGGVAHDFNNILTVVVGYTDVLTAKLDPSLPEQAHLDRIRAACRHGSDLTSRLLAFSRRQVLQRRLLDLNQVVAETLEFLGHVLPETILLEPELAGSLPAVRADRAQIEQVVVNLALNARDAMDGAGRLSIRTSHELGDDPEHPHGLVTLTVEDDGRGMTAEVRERIFEPFFTTKDAGKGSGLGLSMVYGIVEQHGGRLVVRSGPGRGSTFEVHLPCESAQAEPLPVPSPHKERPSGGGRRVLVIEDEPDIREMVAEFLRDHGFVVVSAGTAAEARGAVDASEQPIDALFTDVVLPDGDGVALARELSARQPGLPVVLASGYSRSLDDLEQLLRLETYRFLPKPYSPRALVTALDELLRRSDEAQD